MSTSAVASLSGPQSYTVSPTCICAGRRRMTKETSSAPFSARFSATVHSLALAASKPAAWAMLSGWRATPKAVHASPALALDANAIAICAFLRATGSSAS